jgi:hypothetical protein
MDILTVATLDFAEHLRKVTKGWRIDPIVQAEMFTGLRHRGETIIFNPPTGQSYTDFFVSERAAWEEKVGNVESEFSLIRIKIPDCGLRIIQCCLVENAKLRVTYWRAERQPANDPCRTSRDFRIARASAGRAAESIRTLLIERVTKGTKNRGKKRPGKPGIIHRDQVEIGLPESALAVASIVKVTIDKSFDDTDLWTRRVGFTRSPRPGKGASDRLAVVINGENFYYDDYHAISGRLVHMADNMGFPVRKV